LAIASAKFSISSVLMPISALLYEESIVIQEIVLCEKIDFSFGGFYPFIISALSFHRNLYAAANEATAHLQSKKEFILYYIMN